MNAIIKRVNLASFLLSHAISALFWPEETAQILFTNEHDNTAKWSEQMKREALS